MKISELIKELEAYLEDEDYEVYRQAPECPSNNREVNRVCMAKDLSGILLY